MRFITKNFILLSIVFSLFFHFSCRKDEVFPRYRVEWKLDLSTYLNVNFSRTGTIFKSILMENGLILINVYADNGTFNGYRWFLVELDPSKGEFVGYTEILDATFVDIRKKNNGQILVEKALQPTNYGDRPFPPKIAISEYSFGIYDEITSTIKFDLPMDFRHRLCMGDNFVYTYNSNVLPESTNTAYITKWDFGGNIIWSNILNSEDKISLINVVKEDHLLFTTVANFDLPEELHKVNRISANGDIIWSRKVNDFGGVYQVLEDKMENFYTIHQKAIFKFDNFGNEIWRNTLDNYNESQGNISSNTTSLTSDGGLLLNYLPSYGVPWKIDIIKLDEKGEIQWTSGYKEDGNLSAPSFLELPNEDIITTTLAGYVTKYIKN